ncbi:hypothetical protein GCM10025770_19830 [Viridibacterium curvum]|uniref:Heparin lyase I family protein n=1 Tax=Viridibacterium curvum TaxID=1101404 RepID=A0ABP9QP03_9RHOO
MQWILTLPALASCGGSGGSSGGNSTSAGSSGASSSSSASGGSSSSVSSSLSSSSGTSSSSTSNSTSSSASSAQLTPAQASYRHGDTLTITQAGGNPQVIHTFLGGAGGVIESPALGAKPANGQGWAFDQLGGPTTIANDAVRGKVLFTPEHDASYNATRRFDPGAPIAEQRYFYKAHWVRNVMTMGGVPYAKSYQWKHERISWQDSVVDTDCEIKVHDLFNNSGGQINFVNRSAASKSTYYTGSTVADNAGWTLMEIMVFTGTQGLNDGKVITRAHHGGETRVRLNRQSEMVYADPSLRLRYFIEQNYFGNFGQKEDGVDNKLPKPDVRELYSDDSRVILGQDTVSGWQRVELRDTPSLQTATVRELQTWTVWNDSITLTLNTGGLSAGSHDLYLCVIDGVDANGWDVVRHALPLRVVV